MPGSRIWTMWLSSLTVHKNLTSPEILNVISSTRGKSAAIPQDLLDTNCWLSIHDTPRVNDEPTGWAGWGLLSQCQQVQVRKLHIALGLVCLISFQVVLFYMYRCFACICVWALHACLVPTQGIRSPWKWSFRWLWAVMWAWHFVRGWTWKWWTIWQRSRHQRGRAETYVLLSAFSHTSSK